MIFRNYQLEWNVLQPDITRFQHVSLSHKVTHINCFSIIQKRLYSGLNLLLKTRAQVPIMIIKSPESDAYLTFFESILSSMNEANKKKETKLYGGRYEIAEGIIHWYPAQNIQDNFASDGNVYHAGWIENQDLLGCVRFYQSKISLSPGLVHRANGGVLILPIRTLLAQPLIWLRLKKIITCKQFEWCSNDEKKPLPLDIPPMPIYLRLLLVGECDILEEFQNLEPELSSISIYGEFEDKIQIVNDLTLMNWKVWVQNIANSFQCTNLDTTFWPVLMHEGVRWTGDQASLPLDLEWIRNQIQGAILHSQEEIISGETLQKALNERAWREGFLSEQILNHIEQEQIHIDTLGSVIGQINALSVLRFPGHPSAFGEPVRISCVVHFGDGELSDVERKVALGGNIHSKSLIIIQSWLMSVLQLNQPMPFSASLVFEQSYTEVDGDSASLAALCALISALSLKPINQKIAVTGSLDQFGHVQSVGGINEKIEGFFRICNKRTLSGNQGVIIPSSNIQNLALHKDVIHAVKNNQFYIWAVSNVEEALFLLTEIAWKNKDTPSLFNFITNRILKLTTQDSQKRIGPLHWLRFLK
ncbi:AAA family ATPase [Candidatus Erwinia haradaeae]|uniref:endopeptidase La n=1 Tax=Candidatus Erwinia haradaeae TaxID=1922217 RepID=A0A451D2E9_9GAMM|nr:Lon protease family protein [Candidatus Erwinia haradaeae]VFP79811.1 Putative Lon protease homolog [Candidatus Erwinia haradaeae]